MTTHCITPDIDTCKSKAAMQQSWLSKVLAIVNGWWLSRRRRSIDRQVIKHLLTLDDAMLRDIGVNRGDVKWASTLPKSVDAAVELEIIARGGRRSRR